MFEIELHYDNSDGQFSYDTLIHSAIGRWGGEEVGSGQGLDNVRDSMYAFDGDEDRQAAWEDLQAALGDQAAEITATFWPDPEHPWTPQEIVSVLTLGPYAWWKHCNDLGAIGSHSAQEVSDRFSRRFQWDFAVQADVLLNWCGEGMIEPLLRHIQEAGNTADFEEFLIDNFEEQPADDGAERLDR